MNTACWNCGTHYLKQYSCCPQCYCVNANHAPELAILQKDAPALLDALESVLSEAIDEYYEATDPDGIISKARALIAKHRGGK